MITIERSKELKPAMQLLPNEARLYVLAALWTGERVGFRKRKVISSVP